MGELRCPFCNSASDGPTALREHLLVCEDFTTVYGSPFGSVSIRDLESAMRESSRIIASVGWWYGKIRGLINKAKHAAPSPATPEAEGAEPMHQDWCASLYSDRMNEEGTKTFQRPCNCGASPPAAQPSPGANQHATPPYVCSSCHREVMYYGEGCPVCELQEALYCKAAAQEQKPVAWMIPKRLTIEGAIRHNVPKGWEGKVGWEPSLFGDANPVTDKDGVTHRPYPLFASPIPASGWVKCSERMPPQGEDVLAYWPRSEPQDGFPELKAWMACASWIRQRERLGGWSWANHDYSGTQLPSHWMPLPVAPGKTK